MPKLTDEQIVQTLKYCFENANCKGCILFAEDSCSALLKSNALDLINRLKADNKRLWEDCDYFEEKAKTTKTEAYKEFAERLCEDRVSNDPVVIAVKVELEELVGE